MRWFLAAFFACTLLAADSTPLFDAIYRNDLAAVKRLASGKAAANVAGDHGNTALMYACSYGSPESVRILLQAGADVNALNELGATALMFATSEPGKIKLLLSRHPNVNAKTKTGRTALIVAASQPGSDAAVDLLLLNGADVNASDRDGLTFIGAASNCGNSRQVKIALDRGVKADTYDTTGFTPLMNAAGSGDLASVKLLLARGADVNAVSSPSLGKVMHGDIALGTFSPMLLASSYGPPALIDELIHAGAKVNAQDVRGMTPLLLATATEHRDPEVLRLLRAAKADEALKAKNGETALDWANKYSRRNAADFKEPDITSRMAAERGLALLRKSSDGFLAASGCVACHAQPLAGIAMRVAKDIGGMEIPDADLAAQIPLAKGRWTGMRDMLLLRQDTPGGTDELNYNLFYLAAVGVGPDPTTSAMVINIIENQRPNGGWHFGGIARAPMEDSDITRAAMSLHAMQLFGWPGRDADLKERIGRARAWLKTAKPVFNEEFAMQLMGLKWAGDATAAMLSTNLAATQNPDGGWSQNPTLDSDAYATGMTLFALHEAGMASSDPTYQRGVRFLRATQQADGSWHVRSRSPKFQPYFESGFPHGDDQWISMAATAWATMACSM